MAAGPARLPEPVAFGDGFELDVNLGQLRRGGRVLRLERVPTELLALLVEHRGGIVTREQIVARLWRPGIFLDTDNSINGAVRKIRQVLRDNPEYPRYVQTVTGKGYRFIAPVAERNQDASVPERAVGEAPRRRSARRWALAVLLLASMAAAAYLMQSRVVPHRAKSEEHLKLAVLPFENLTDDAGQEYFADGLTEELITQLGRDNAQRLGVIARTSVMRFKKTRTPLNQIGGELGVQYILEGSVRREGEKVRITAQLIRVQDQTHLWAREYDRDLRDLLTLEAELAEEVGQEIRTTLGEARSPTITAKPPLLPREYEAYDLYLKGEYALSKRTIADFRTAIDEFEKAVALDPANARAYAALADSYALIGGYGGVPPEEYIRKARSAAVRALQIDERLPDAHAALALILQNYDWDWKTAEKEFRRALELNPNYATGHQWYAEHLMWRGRFDEALRESDQARQLDPLSAIIAADHGAVLFYARQYDRSIQQFRAVFTMAPGFSRAHLIAYAYVEKGMFEEARTHLAQKWQGPWYWASVAFVEGRAGHPAEARHAFEQLQREGRRQAIDPGVFARAYLGLGDSKHALASLDNAYSQHSTTMVGLAVDPAFDPLRSDAQFQVLLQKVGLSQ